MVLGVIRTIIVAAAGTCGLYTLGGTGINVAQGAYPLCVQSPLEGAELHRLQCLRDPDATLKNMSRSEIVQLWHSLPPPRIKQMEGAYDGHVLHKGPLHPVSRFISHRLFGQGRGVWLGKEIRDNGSAGPNKVSWELGQEIHVGGSNGNNVFVESDGIQTFLGTTTRFRDFKVERCPSKLDKQPCVALDYNIGGKHSRSSCVWRGMRDELRMLHPGYYIGCGSMKVFGGMPNFTLFTLKKRTNKF